MTGRHKRMLASVSAELERRGVELKVPGPDGEYVAIEVDDLYRYIRAPERYWSQRDGEGEGDLVEDELIVPMDLPAAR